MWSVWHERHLQMWLILIEDAYINENVNGGRLPWGSLADFPSNGIKKKSQYTDYAIYS
jgi:hypothetical protein